MGVDFNSDLVLKQKEKIVGVKFNKKKQLDLLAWFFLIIPPICLKLIANIM